MFMCPDKLLASMGNNNCSYLAAPGPSRLPAAAVRRAGTGTRRAPAPPGLRSSATPPAAGKAGLGPGNRETGKK